MLNNYDLSNVIEVENGDWFSEGHILNHRYYTHYILTIYSIKIKNNNKEDTYSLYAFKTLVVHFNENSNQQENVTVFATYKIQFVNTNSYNCTDVVKNINIVMYSIVQQYTTILTIMFN